MATLREHGRCFMTRESNLMRGSRLATWVIAGVVFLAGAPVVWKSIGNAAEAADAKAAESAEAKDATATQFPSELCLGCHGNPGFSAPGPDGKMRPLSVDKDKFEKSVHGKRLCVECHKNITEVPHQKGIEVRVSCVECHEALWATARKEHKTQENVRLGVVVQQIEHYMKSIHARPSREDQSRPNHYRRATLQHYDSYCKP